MPRISLNYDQATQRQHSRALVTFTRRTATARHEIDTTPPTSRLKHDSTTMAPSAINDAPGRNSPKPPPTRIWNVSEPPFEGFKAVDSEGYVRSNRETAIIIDNGTTQLY